MNARLTWRWTLVLVAALVLGAISACPASAAPTAHRTLASPILTTTSPAQLTAFTAIGPGTGQLALLGDSYSAGEGAGPYDAGTDTSSNTCHRSANSWERVFAAATLPYQSGNWTHVACSGAVLNDYWYANSSNAGEPPQNTALSPNTGLALMTLVGNDIGFAEVAQNCILAGLNGTDTCKTTYVINGVDTELQRIQAKQQELTDILIDARNRAPNADIHISTYPNIISDDSRLFCLQDANMAQSDRQWLKGLTRALDDVIINAANAAGVDVVDVFGAFAGHELCTSDPWANPLLSTSSKNEWFHPNAEGYTAWANIMLSTIQVNFGGLDLNSYCQARGYDGVSLDGTTAYDWHCDLGGATYSIDMHDACGWQYGSAPGGWYPHYNYGDPYSWTCWRGSGVNRGGLDLNSYCQARGYDGVSLDGTTAYDWHCDLGGATYGIDLVDACSWQYAPAYSGAWEPRYSDFNNPYSWSCWRV